MIYIKVNKSKAGLPALLCGYHNTTLFDMYIYLAGITQITSMSTYISHSPPDTPRRYLIPSQHS